MANQSRWNTPPNYRDDDRPYGRNQYGPRGRYASRVESADEYGYNPERSNANRDGTRWEHEQDYYGSAPYTSANSSREHSASRYSQPDYGQRDYGHRDRGAYGQQGYGRETGAAYSAPYGAREEYRAYRDNYGQSYGQQTPSTYGSASDYRDYSDDERGFFARAGDEVRSWFGDDDAARRRERDVEQNYGYAGGSAAYGSDYRSDYRGKGPKDYFRSDDRIREDVCDRLTDDSRIDATDVEVRVQQGEVTLTGSVADRNAKRRVEDSVDRISGVKQVQNNLRIEPATTSYTSGYERSSYNANDIATSNTGDVATTSSGVGMKATKTS